MSSDALVTAPSSRPRASAGAALVAAYLGAIWVFAELPALLGVPRHALVEAVAFSPIDLVHGRLWLLPLSGLAAAGDTTAQIGELAPVAACLVLLGGARTFWRAAIAGHVGSTLVAYAVVGILVLVDPQAVGGVLSAPDFGISCVWAGSLGALAVAGARRCARPAAAVAIVAAASLPTVRLLDSGLTTDGGVLQLATLEHGLAFALGAAAVAADRSPVRRVRRWSLLGRRPGPRRPVSAAVPVGT